MGVKAFIITVFLLFFLASSYVLSLETSAYSARSASVFNSYNENRQSPNAPNSIPQILSVDPPNYFPFNTPTINVTVTTDINANCYYGFPAELNVTDMFIFDVTGGTTHNTTLNALEEGSWYTYFKCQDVLSGDISDPLEYDFEIDFTAPSMIFDHVPDAVITGVGPQQIIANFSDSWMGFYEEQLCYYCIGLVGYCDNNSNWNRTDYTILVNESDWYFHGTCGHDLNISTYPDGNYEFGVWIADIAYNTVSVSGNFSINMPEYPLILNGYNISNTTAFDGDVIFIYSNWTLNLSLTNSTDINCTLYSGNAALQIVSSNESACSFNYTMSQSDYPNSSFYINAMTLEGYNVSTPEMFVSLNACGMNITHNLTLQDDMICSNNDWALIMASSADNQTAIDCTGHSITSGRDGMSGIVINDPTVYGIIKNCDIENFQTGIIHWNSSISIQNSILQNNDIGVISASGPTDIVDTDMFNTSILDGDNTTIIVNHHATIRDSSIAVDSIIIEGILEIMNSTLIISNQTVGIEGNFTGIYTYQTELINQSVEINASRCRINIFANNLTNISSISLLLAWKNISRMNNLNSLRGFDMELSGLEADALENAYVEIYYNDSEIRNLDESSLKVYYFNRSNGSWSLMPVQGVDVSHNMLWFNITHLSSFGVFANTYVPPTPPPPKTGGGGGGGGGGGYVPPKINVTQIPNVSNRTAAEVVNVIPRNVTNTETNASAPVGITDISLKQDNSITGFVLLDDIQKTPPKYIIGAVIIIAIVVAAIFLRKTKRVKHKK